MSVRCKTCDMNTHQKHKNTDDCVQALRKSHAVSKSALNQVHGIVKAFVQDPKILARVDKIVTDALREMGEELTEATPKRP